MSMLTRLLGLSRETSHRLNESSDALQEGGDALEAGAAQIETASEFLQRLAQTLRSSGSRSLGDAVIATLPWLKDLGEVVGDVVPPMRVVLNIVKRLTKETDPRALGLLAFSLAYQTAVADAVKSIERERGSLRGAERRAKATDVGRRLRDEPETLESFEDFRLENCLEHRLVRRADAMLGEICDVAGWSPEPRKLLLAGVHSRFGRTFQRLITMSDTAEKFEPLRQYLLLMPPDPANRHAHALAITISREDRDKTLTVGIMNRGTHVIEDIEVNAIPDDENWLPASHGPLPQVVERGSDHVELFYPIAGGWFHARCAKLSPGRGYSVLAAKLRDGDYSRMDFDAFWNDHEGMQRKVHGVVEVRSCPGDVPLEPRIGFRP